MESKNEKYYIEKGYSVTEAAEMAQERKVSFVVPVYKTEKYLEECLKSLLNQDYKNIEIIVVLDGENWRARRVVCKLMKKDSRIAKLHTIKHAGAPTARNEGFKFATGHYVSFWDSDCYANTGMVRVWVKAFALYSDVDFVYSGYRFRDTAHTFYPSEPFNKYTLTCNNYVATMFPMKREIFPGFDPSLKSLQDWDMWLTLVDKEHKGMWIEGEGFQTEAREGISSKGCKPEEWLNRYKKIREKHGIKNRDICFTSMVHTRHAQELAELYGQDYSHAPSYHPHEYKAIYMIGVYSARLDVAMQNAFGNSTPKGCKKILHWMGDDLESLQTAPYKVYLMLMDTIKKKIDMNYCENEQTQKMLKEAGIEATVMPLPMVYKEIPMPDKFNVYYETDEAGHDVIQSVIKSLPNIKIDSPENADLKDYACFMSITGSIMPSENFKRFLAAGRYAVSTYSMLYGNKVDIDREKIVKALVECQKNFKAGKHNEKAATYYQNLIDPKRFEKEVIQKWSK